MMSTSKTDFEYRPDIDGLIGLAVLAVVIFHAFPDWLPSGFVGVDIFFIISGFLITDIIVDEINRGSFSITRFYSRRVLRIFPALALVLVSCLFVGWFCSLPHEYKQLGKHVASSSSFISNFIFWQEAGYFDTSAETKPLLHIWSLSIEEQFYLIWPLGIWVMYRWRKYIFTLTILAIVASITYSGNLVHQAEHVKDFYSPLSRSWELLLGVLLALGIASVKRAHPGIHLPLLRRIPIQRFDLYAYKNNLAQFSSFLGLFILIVGLILIDQTKPFPGSWALFPTLGTALIILGGSHSWINRNFLSRRTLINLGLISYPLYLWHWSLLLFATIVDINPPSNQLKCILIGISIICSALTYKLIEQPIRFGQHLKIKTLSLISITILIGTAGYQTYINDGFVFRSPNPSAQMILDATEPTEIRASAWIMRITPRNKTLS